MFLKPQTALQIRERFGSPVFVYDQASLEARAREVLAFPNAFGLKARYAMKACSTAEVLRVLTATGLHIDASSAFEVERAIRAGVPAEHIQLTTQELPADLAGIVSKGVSFNACSLRQLRAYGGLFPGAEVCVRINPGMGSGHNNRTNVAGPAASFGIWHEYLDDVEAVRKEFDLTISAMHSHVGSGSDPEIWNRCALLTLGVAAQLPDVKTVSLGGGFKVGRMPGEESADLQKVGAVISKAFEDFAKEHGRKLKLEVEPGTYLVANAGALVATVDDVVDTGADGYSFIKINSGMTEVLRPSIYGAQHPIEVVPATDEPRGEREYVVAGHCCESGDILTPAPGDPEGLAPRLLTEAKIGDALIVGGAGAYCASMSPRNYNSFPESAEVLLTTAGEFKLIRKRQTLDQILENEI
jgi:diaminopimelate decarboxylase